MSITAADLNGRPYKYTCHYQPRHRLAKRIIKQIESLELRPQHIVQQMGYAPKHTIPACDRLRHVLSHPYLGLDSSYIDARFTAERFLETLLSVVDIAYETIEDDVAHLQYQLSHHLNTAPKEKVIAKTSFACN